MAAGVRVVVVGAGPVGLGTAVNIQERIPALDLTLMADKFSPNVTADVSGGLLLPHAVGNTPTTLMCRWTGATLDYCGRLFNSEYAADCGISRCYGYMLSEGKQPDPAWKHLIPDFRHAAQEETLVTLREYKTVWAMTSYILECSRYLPWLLDRFRRNGGKVVKRKVADLMDLRSEYDIIVNCTGIGAHELGDKSVTPLRGQTIRVHAPWVKHFLCIEDGEHHCYFLPGVDTLLLGGIQVADDWNLDVDKDDRDYILRNCSKLLPALKKAPIVSEWVGLRPGRDRVRLEVETIKSDDLTTKIVHNYGHGGSGVTLHWGCGQDAAELVRQCVEEFSETKAKI